MSLGRLNPENLCPGLGEDSCKAMTPGDLVVNPGWDRRIGIVLGFEDHAWIGTRTVRVFGEDGEYTCFPEQLDVLG